MAKRHKLNNTKKVQTVVKKNENTAGDVDNGNNVSYTVLTYPPVHYTNGYRVTYKKAPTCWGLPIGQSLLFYVPFFLWIILTGVSWGMFENNTSNIGQASGIVVNFTKFAPYCHPTDDEKCDFLFSYQFVSAENHQTYNIINVQRLGLDAYSKKLVIYPIGGQIDIFYLKNNPYNSFLSLYAIKLEENYGYYVSAMVFTPLLCFWTVWGLVIVYLYLGCCCDLDGVAYRIFCCKRTPTTSGEELPQRTIDL
jgi:hypothetical protein